MPWYLLAYIALASAVALVCYVVGVAYIVDDDELPVVIVMGCTIVPLASALVGAAWPLALFAFIIWLAVND